MQKECPKLIPSSQIVVLGISCNGQPKRLSLNFRREGTTASKDMLHLKGARVYHPG